MTQQEKQDETTKDSDKGSAQESAELSLDRRYRYQSPTAGTVSATSLTVRQLCRMFSPPSSTTSKFNSDSQILALEVDGQTYAPEGWKPARDVPVLKHAAFNSLYYTQNGASKGPISCRELSALRFQSDEPIDPAKDQVYGESTANQWVLLRSLPDLELALEAFRVQQPSKANTEESTATTNSSNTQDYDVSVMVYEDEASNLKDNDSGKVEKDSEKEVQDELEAFLSSTDHMGPQGMAAAIGNAGGNAEEEDDEGYESDGGTNYVKDPRTGQFIHEALRPPRKDPAQPPPNKKAKTQQNNSNNSGGQTKKKGKKAKFSAKNAKCWIYITGLPPDTTEEELAKFFSKVGIIDLDPGTQRPKLKLYRHKTDSQGPDGVTIKAGTCKGDASICYARPESVALALQVLDEAPFRDAVQAKDNYRLHVERAKFEQFGETYHSQRQRFSEAQRKVAKLAVKQARDWDEGEFNGRLTGGLKGLRIIVLRRLFHPSEFRNEKEEDALLAELESKVRSTSEEFGTVEKITVFSKNPQGVLVIKFAQPGAASEAVKALDGKCLCFGKKDRKVGASFWDGVEDFTIRDEAKDYADTEKRHDAFGAWIESHGEEELPEELRLRVEN